MEEPSKETLIQKIRQSLARAKERHARLRTIHTTLGAVALAAGALSTLFAGGSAAVGRALAGPGDVGWRVTCGIAALLTFAGTLSTGIVQQFRVAEQLGSNESCTGRLNALEVGLTVGNLPVEQGAQKYAELVAEFPKVLG